MVYVVYVLDLQPEHGLITTHSRKFTQSSRMDAVPSVVQRVELAIATPIGLRANTSIVMESQLHFYNTHYFAVAVTHPSFPPPGR